MCSLMSDYQKRMSTTNMRAYTRTSILTYNEIGKTNSLLTCTGSYIIHR